MPCLVLRTRLPGSGRHLVSCCHPASVRVGSGDGSFISWATSFCTASAASLLNVLQLRVSVAVLYMYAILALFATTSNVHLSSASSRRRSPAWSCAVFFSISLTFCTYTLPEPRFSASFPFSDFQTLRGSCAVPVEPELLLCCIV